MQKTLSVFLAVLLLFSLTACGGGLACDPLPLPEDADYHYGMEQLELGNLTKAYGYFKASADPKAAEMLEKFVFVPTKAVRTDSKGRDTVHTYTYDEAGNLLTETDKGDLSRTETLDDVVTYTYNERNQMLSYVYHTGETLNCYYTYTYDDKGNRLTHIYYNADNEAEYGDTYTYDENGHCLTHTYWDKNHPYYEYVQTNTYDDKGRIATCTEADPDGSIESVITYFYEEDGSYRYTVDFTEDAAEFTTTYWCDKEKRVLKKETVNKTANEVPLCNENRYDDQGNQVYNYVREHDREQVTTTTYNAQRLLLTQQETVNGEERRAVTYTYNEAGLPLTYTYQSPHLWANKIYIYDAHNRLTSQDEMSESQWKSLTYTYDEKGNMATKEQKGYYANFVYTYTCDDYGNVTTVDYKEQRADGAIYTSETAMEWTLRYYPDGYAGNVLTVLNDAKRWIGREE